MKRPQRGKTKPVLGTVTPIRTKSSATARPVVTRARVRKAPVLKLNRETANRFRAGTRQKKFLVLGLLTSFSILILVVIATLVTPILAVEKIRITGIHKVSEKSILSAVKSNIGTPLALVNQQAIKDQLAKFTLIESISLISELPHTLHIAVSERQPIAIVDVAGAGMLFDPAGIQLGVAKSSDVLPRVLINDNPRNSRTYAEAIDVLLALPADLLNRVSVVNAKSKDDVRLGLRGYAGQEIIWGDASQAALKSKVLAALIKNQKQTDRVTFDVSSPSAPVVRYR